MLNKMSYCLDCKHVLYSVICLERKQTYLSKNKLTKVLSILGFEVVVCGCSVVSSVNCADLRWLTFGLIQRHHSPCHHMTPCMCVYVCVCV